MVTCFTEPNIRNPSKNDAWLNPDLVKMLLQLGETIHYVRVRELLDGAVRAHPEMLVVVLATCSSKDPAVASLRLYGALLKEILPMYFSPTVGDSTALERQMGVALPLVKRLWAIDPTFVLRACRRAYTTHPTVVAVQHIIRLVRLVEGGGKALMEMSEKDLVIAVACVLSDMKEHDLDKWTTEQMKGVDGSSSTFVEVLLAFLSQHVSMGIQPRASAKANSSPVSLESLTMMLKALRTARMRASATRAAVG